MQPLVFIMPAQVLHDGSSVYVLPYAARREPMKNRLARLTRSQPVLDGPLWPGGLRSAISTSSLVRSDLGDYANRRTLCHLTTHEPVCERFHPYSSSTEYVNGCTGKFSQISTGIPRASPAQTPSQNEAQTSCAP